MTLLEFPNMGRLPRNKGGVEPSQSGEAVEPTDRSEDGRIDPAYRYFSNALKAARLKRGLTQVELSVKAGVALGTVHLAETARQTPTLKSLIILAEGLDLKIGDLLPRSTPTEEEERRRSLAAGLETEIASLRGQLEDALTALNRLSILVEQIRSDPEAPPDPA